MTDPQELYLEPICPNCGDQGEERQWCSEDVWSGEPCDGCGAEVKSVKYQKMRRKP